MSAMRMARFNAANDLVACFDTTIVKQRRFFRPFYPTNKSLPHLPSDGPPADRISGPYGVRFYEHTVPELVKQLERLNELLERLVDRQKGQKASEE